MLIKLFRFFFALYGAIFFSCTLLLVFPAYYLIFLFFGKSAPRLAHQVSQIWARVVVLGLLVNVRFHGRERIEPKQAYVFVGNHQSLLDIPVYALSCKNTFRFLAKHELTKIPVMGFIIRHLYISVKRENKNDRKKSMETMIQSLHENISVFICPEGTRNRTSNPLLEFKDGAFLLAVESQLPIAVLTLKGSRQILPAAGMWSLSPGKIEGYWSEPIQTKGLTEQDIPALKEKVKGEMLRIITS